MARVLRSENKDYVDRRTGRRATRQEAVVTDGKGKLTLVFFKQPWRIDKELKQGRVGLFAGKVTEFNRVRQLAHPECQPLGDEDDPEAAAMFADALIPIYRGSASVQSWVVQRAIAIVLDQLPDELADPLPETVRAAHGLMGLRDALVAVHRPQSMAQVHAAQDRLRWDEAFLLQTVLASAAQRSPARCRPPPAPPGPTACSPRSTAAAVPAHRRSGRGRPRDLARPGAAPPDAAAAAGRGRVRQDDRGPAGDAHRRRRRRSGRPAGAHRGPRAAAPSLDHRDAGRPGRARPARRRRRRHPGRAADRVDDRGGATGGAARRRCRATRAS